MNPSAEVVVFACNWSGLSCVEAAAHEGLCFPASVKVVRVSCLSRVHLGLMLKAFEVGAEGVMLVGCKPEECHYGMDSDYLCREHEKTCQIMRLLGFGADRLAVAHVARGDGDGFVAQLTDFVSRVGVSCRPGAVPPWHASTVPGLP